MNLSQEDLRNVKEYFGKKTADMENTINTSAATRNLLSAFTKVITILLTKQSGVQLSGGPLVRLVKNKNFAIEISIQKSRDMMTNVPIIERYPSVKIEEPANIRGQIETAVAGIAYTADFSVSQLLDLFEQVEDELIKIINSFAQEVGDMDAVISIINNAIINPAVVSVGPVDIIAEIDTTGSEIEVKFRYELDSEITIKTKRDLIF